MYIKLFGLMDGTDTGCIMTQKSSVPFSEFEMGYHMHIPNSEAPPVSKILEIAPLKQLYVTNLFPCTAVSII